MNCFQIAEVLPGLQRDLVLGLCQAIEQVSGFDFMILFYFYNHQYIVLVSTQEKGSKRPKRNDWKWNALVRKKKSVPSIHNIICSSYMGCFATALSNKKAECNYFCVIPPCSSVLNKLLNPEPC